jgi:hypothetical protein
LVAVGLLFGLQPPPRDPSLAIDPPHVVRLRRLADELGSLPLRLVPWPGQEGTWQACPVVVAATSRVRAFTARLPAGVSIRLPSGDPLTAGQTVRVGEGGLREGIRWVDVPASAITPRSVLDLHPTTDSSLPWPGPARDLSRQMSHFRKYVDLLSDRTLTLDDAGLSAAVEKQAEGLAGAERDLVLGRLDITSWNFQSTLGVMTGEGWARRWTDPGILARARALLTKLDALLSGEPGRWDGWHEASVVFIGAGRTDLARLAQVRALAAQPGGYVTWALLAQTARDEWLGDRLRIPRSRGIALADPRRRGIEWFDTSLALFTREQDGISWANYTAERAELSGGKVMRSK